MAGLDSGEGRTVLTNETGKNINKSHIMNHSTEFGRIERNGHVGEPKRK